MPKHIDVFRFSFESTGALGLLDTGYNHDWAIATKAQAEFSLGDGEAGAQTLQRALQTTTPMWRGRLIPALVMADRFQEANQLLAEAEASVPAPLLILIPAYAALGIDDRAFSAIHRAIEDRVAIALLTLRVDPIYAKMRKDPRWQEVMRHLADEEAKGRAENPLRPRK